jgi:hypothetical protein
MSQIFSKILKFSLSFERTPGVMILLALSSVIALGNLSVNKIFDQELCPKNKNQELITRQNHEMKGLNSHVLITRNI